MKLWKRILSCFLALLLTVYLLPVQVMAEELGDLWPLTTENIAETPPDVIGEVLDGAKTRKNFCWPTACGR